MIIVESKIVLPSTSKAGTSPRGLAAANRTSRCPVPKASGSTASNGTPFSRIAILTF